MTACEALDPFFDGELPTDGADQFREHLAWCAHCQADLHGRMLEAAIADDAAPIVVPLRPRRRRWAWSGLAVVMAAAAAIALVAAWPSPRRREIDVSLQVEVSLEAPSALAIRGDRRSGAVFDHIHASVRTAARHHTLWIYRDSTQLLLICAAACADRGAELVAMVPGTYSVVAVSSDHAIPAPIGLLDLDVAAARASGATNRIEQLKIR